jgi:DNA mismatch endonuclease (patch repair protein)
MRRVRQRGTKAENAVAKLLRELGFAYRRNVRSLPGSPDFANKSSGWAVFVNGCFWHQHPGCRRATIPRRNHEFWVAKFVANKARDAAAIDALTSRGMRVVVIWECEAMMEEELAARLVELRGR